MSMTGIGSELGRYLSLLSQRQEVIAANIANADTPGYKTRDVDMPADFSGVLEHTRASVSEVQQLPSRGDGNNVALDREARLLAENDVRFNVAVQLIRGELKAVRSAIDEGRTT